MGSYVRCAHAYLIALIHAFTLTRASGETRRGRMGGNVFGVMNAHAGECVMYLLFGSALY